MSDLSGLRADDPLVVSLGQGKYSHRTVARVARTWLTDNLGCRHRIADGWGLNGGIVTLALPLAEWEAGQETDRLSARLMEWGWNPALRGKTLTLPQLRRAAALVSEFDGENRGGML